MALWKHNHSRDSQADDASMTHPRQALVNFANACFRYMTSASIHNSPRLISESMVVNSFRIAATKANFFGFPFASSRW